MTGRRLVAPAIGTTLAVVALLAAGARGARAQSLPPPPVTPDRPDFTNGAQIVPPGLVQLEAGAGLARDGGDRVFDVGEFNLRLPVSPRLEVDLAIGGWQESSGSAAARGQVDGAVGCKVKAYDGGAAGGDPGTVDVAVLLGAVVPTGSASVAERAFQPSVTVAADVNLAGGLGVGVNVGVLHGRQGGTRFDQLFGGCSFGFDLGRGASRFAEGFAWGRAGPDTPTRRIADVGVLVPWGNAVVVDVRCGVDLADPRTKQFAGVGLTVRW